MLIVSIWPINRYQLRWDARLTELPHSTKPRCRFPVSSRFVLLFSYCGCELPISPVSDFVQLRYCPSRSGRGNDQSRADGNLRYWTSKQRHVEVERVRQEAERDGVRRPGGSWDPSFRDRWETKTYEKLGCRISADCLLKSRPKKLTYAFRTPVGWFLSLRSKAVFFQIIGQELS